MAGRIVGPKSGMGCRIVASIVVRRLSNLLEGNTARDFDEAMRSGLGRVDPASSRRALC